MKIAILHDYLNQFGGGERVLRAIVDIFPNADIYTLFYDENKTFGIFKECNIKTSFLDNFIIRNYHKLFIPLMPLGAYFLKSEKNYDLIISSTAGYGKGINVCGKYHISYCHSPLRYAWEIDYIKNLKLAPKPIFNIFAYPILKTLRNWDKKTSAKVNVFITNSNFTAQRIKYYYQRKSIILHPPVDTEKFYFTDNKNKKEYYLMVGRFIYYKNFDLAISAFRRLPQELKIVGSGPEEKKIKKMIAQSKNIKLIKNINDDELRDLYNNAKALIFPQIEDFGLVAAEAQCCGAPVIAYEKGGINDIVTNGKTGLLFKEQNAESIIKAIKNFENKKWDRKEIAETSSKKFSKKKFTEKFINILKNCGINL